MVVQKVEGGQPQVFTQSMFDDPKTGSGIKDFLTLVKPGEPWSISTRLLLQLNGNSRRGSWVNQKINDALEGYGLVCSPEIENADYYGSVTVSDPRDDLQLSAASVSVPVSAFGSGESLFYCSPAWTIKKVLSTMIARDFSQIPVLSNNRRRVDGVVTWKSLALAPTDGSVKTVVDVMEPPGHIAASSDRILDLIDTVISQEYLLYTAPGDDGQVIVDGICTATDLAQSFDSSTGVYLRLEEIESRIRVLLNRAPLPALEKHHQRHKTGSLFRGATDMTMGEYVQALRDSEIWEATRIDLDQDDVIDLIDKVREIRNDAMHFSVQSMDASSNGPSTDENLISRTLRTLRAIPL